MAPALLETLAGLGLAALSSIPLATLLIGPQGPVFINSAADNLLSLEDGLSPSARYGLAATSRDENRRLQDSIQNALYGDESGPLPVTRHKAPLPLLVSVAPLRDGDAAAGLGSRCFALVLIHDPLAGCAAAGRRALVGMYGLTEAEASVAVAIVGGRNAKRIASQRKVSVPTIRSQIRQILAKTGCGDQRSLISRFGWLGVAV